MTSIALIGDSVRMHYQPVVAEALAAIAPVWGPDTNCESSRRLAAHLEERVLDRLDTPTIVHVNAGAHDVRRVPESDWGVQIPVAEYRVNMADILDRLLTSRHVAQVIVATTIPVDEVRHEAARYSNRLNSDIEAYNQVLIDVANERGLAINDLWAEVANCPFDPIAADGAHLTQDGSDYLGRHVAQFLKLTAESHTVCGQSPWTQPLRPPGRHPDAISTMIRYLTWPPAFDHGHAGASSHLCDG